MEYHIAVVDDDTTSLTNVRSLLISKGMKVSCLRSGNDLLKYMEKHEPDLILLDVLMPEMDGFETFNRLRYLEERLERKRTPVIFLTGENDIETERRGLKLGASDFIHKPLNKDIITRRIDNTIKNQKTIESLTEEATIDKLTGFYNKAFGTARIAEMSSNSTGALMMLDLDNFKLVNDLYGHDMGDRVLMAFADVIRGNTRESDIISRIGGDEFMGYFTDIFDEKAVAALTERLNAELANRAAVLMGDDHGIPLGISVGVVLVTEQGADFKTLFSQADNAMYEVKNHGKHTYAIHSDVRPEEIIDRGDLGQELERISRIMEERSEEEGAFVLGMDAFSPVYRFIVRFNKMYRRSAMKVLFAISPEEGSENGDLKPASDALLDMLQRLLRKSDIIMPSRVGQFFVFLPELSADDVSNVTERVKNEWDKSEFSHDFKIDFALKEIDN